MRQNLVEKRIVWTSQNEARDENRNVENRKISNEYAVRRVAPGVGAAAIILDQSQSGACQWPTVALALRAHLYAPQRTITSPSHISPNLAGLLADRWPIVTVSWVRHRPKKS